MARVRRHNAYLQLQRLVEAYRQLVGVWLLGPPHPVSLPLDDWERAWQRGGAAEAEQQLVHESQYRLVKYGSRLASQPVRATAPKVWRLAELEGNHTVQTTPPAASVVPGSPLNAARPRQCPDPLLPWIVVRLLIASAVGVLGLALYGHYTPAAPRSSCPHWLVV